MPTLPDPPPPLTPGMSNPDRSIWRNISDPAKFDAAVFSRAIELLNASPTAREQLWDYQRAVDRQDANAISIIPGNSAQYDNREGRIDIGAQVGAWDPGDPNSIESAARNLAGSIAHELGHYIDDANIDAGDVLFGKPGSEATWVMNRMASEGIAAINNYRILDEIKTHTGVEIWFGPSEAAKVIARQAAANHDFRTPQDIDDGYSIDDAARQRVGAEFSSAIPSTSGNGQTYWQELWQSVKAAVGPGNSPSPWIAHNFNLAKNWVFTRDPFTLDLDGGGIQTSGSTDSSIVFDYDGDGIRTGTGWIRAGEAFLVADRNADGVIDTGAELFGVDTLLPSGLLAKDGFSAIAPLDTNADGKIDITDTPVSAWQIAFDVNGDGIIATGETRALQFTDLMVWQDINQNGVSEASELRTLTEAGIASISTAKTVVNTNLGNGNRITGTGVFTRADGSAGGTANLDLAELRFFREYVNPPEAPASANELPDMEGSGSVSRLRVAAATDPVLHPTLRGFAAGETRAEQRANLDALIGAWADTSAMRGSREAASDLAPGESSRESDTKKYFGSNFHAA